MVDTYKTLRSSNIDLTVLYNVSLQKSLRQTVQRQCENETLHQLVENNRLTTSTKF